MADLDTRPGPRDYLFSLRQHVRKPISNALETAQQEHREVTRERDALDAFADRVSDFSTISSASISPSTVSLHSSQQSTDIEGLRQAYRETVMAVPHYDEVYDESLVSNVRAELGPEIATLFESNTEVSLISVQQQTVITAARQRAADRDKLCETLDAEISSLRSLRADLTAVLEELDSTIVPGWYRERFKDKLMAIITTRQSQLEERSLSHLDGHNLCESLYQNEPQTYPVLMAVARLRDCVTLQ